MTRVFDNVPEREVNRGGITVDTTWQDTFKHLAERARETTWGLPAWDQSILGLCVMLEESLAREAELSNVQNKLKGLQMENGRLRKQVREANDRVLDVKSPIAR